MEPNPQIRKANPTTDGNHLLVCWASPIQ
jgi:hypothetical protein